MAVDREALLHRVETDRRLDRVADRLAPVARLVKGSGTREGVLSGTWIGHPLHPTAVIAPLSCFVSASLLDVVGGRAGRRAARRLIGLGLLTAGPAAAAGLTDWVDTSGAERRVGTVHAVANTAALALYATSWRLRHRGRHGRGVATAALGSALTGAAGYLGGHLSYRRGVGVDTTVFDAGPSTWRPIGRLADLPADRPVAERVDGVTLLVVRRGERAHVLEDRCTHRGGPLHDGELAGGCITCPWHGSRFALDTGQVVRGPATAPQPAYEVQVVDGTIEVRRAEPGGLRTLARDGSDQSPS